MDKVGSEDFLSNLGDDNGLFGGDGADRIVDDVLYTKGDNNGLFGGDGADRFASGIYGGEAPPDDILDTSKGDANGLFGGDGADVLMHDIANQSPQSLQEEWSDSFDFKELSEVYSYEEVKMKLEDEVQWYFGEDHVDIL